MNWLLWREYRLNRWILVTGAVAIGLSYVIGFVIVSFELDVELNEMGPGLVLMWSFLTVALLAGNALAGECADRSGEFIDYLPLERSRRLLSKLMLHVMTLLVLIVVNLPLLGRLFGFTEFAGGVGLALLVYCVNWFVSSIQSSPTLATISGLVALGLVGLIGAFLVEWTMIPNPPDWLPAVIRCSVAAGCLLPIVCFSVGVWHYLHHPCQRYGRTS